MKTCAILVSLAAIAAGAGSVANAADISHGEELARRWCASCHVVASDQQGPSSEAPPFSVIASRPDFDVQRIARFLLEPHPKMPSMALTRSEAADIAAYIGSLAK